MRGVHDYSQEVLRNNMDEARLSLEEAGKRIDVLLPYISELEQHVEILCRRIELMMSRSATARRNDRMPQDLYHALSSDASEVLSRVGYGRQHPDA